VQHRGGAGPPAVEGLGQVFEQVHAVGQAGQPVPERLLFGQPPAQDAGDARGQDEPAVDHRRPPWMGDVGGAVEHGRGVDHAKQPVLGDDVEQGEQERQPRLVQGQEPDDHEELEVRLDRAAGQVDQYRRAGDEPERRAAGRKLRPSRGTIAARAATARTATWAAVGTAGYPRSNA
jgi:hypothetical protein